MFGEVITAAHRARRWLAVVLTALAALLVVVAFQS
ncbi:hypothetical protein MMB232_01010 [Brevundimonas subvibrioides]